MGYNQAHHTTFTALLQLWGFPSEEAKFIGERLAQVDNNVQDQLIEKITLALQKKQSPELSEPSSDTQSRRLRA